MQAFFENFLKIFLKSYINLDFMPKSHEKYFYDLDFHINKVIQNRYFTQFEIYS